MRVDDTFDRDTRWLPAALPSHEERFSAPATATLNHSALLLLGSNHRTTPIALRERLAISPHDWPAVFSSLRAMTSLREIVILSTCNRVECYAVTSDPVTSTTQLVEFLSNRSGIAPAALAPHLYRLEETDVAAHLFRVAGGLDSMILGETEITAQVKQAYGVAQTFGALGPVLHRLFQKSLHSAKLVRSRTSIAEGCASIGSVVAGLAGSLFGQCLSDCEVLLWGAGKAAETTLRHLMKSGIGQLWVVNRTQVKAQELAQQCQSGWLSWEQAQKRLTRVDLAIVCTQAPHYVIDSDDLEMLWPQRNSRPLCIIDLAVPRNVDPSVARYPGLHLYDIDGLQKISSLAIRQRETSREACEALVAEQASYFQRWRWAQAQHEDRACKHVG